MTKKTMLVVASSLGLLACAGCNWLQALYATGSIGGSAFLADWIMSFFS